MSERRLDEQFQWPSDEPLQRDLKRLMAELEARFQGLEAVAGSFEESVQDFNELGLSRLNDLLTPLASEAVDRLQDITRLFAATSTTTATIALGEHTFVIPVDQRNTFVPTPYLAIDAVGHEDVGMIASRGTFDRETGNIVVNAVALAGSGTYSSWQLSTSPSPSLGGYSRGQTDDAIAAAVDALDATITAALSAKAALASPAFTGTPTVPTPAAHDDSSRIANTAWVQDEAAYIADQITDAAIAGLPTSTIDVATVAQVRGATVGDHAIVTPLLETASAAVGLTDAATISIDWKTGINFTVTLAGNRTLGNPANGIPGTWRTVQVTQDANGTRTLAYGNQYVFPDGSAPVIATGAGKVSRISIYCRSTTVFEVYGIGMGFA